MSQEFSEIAFDEYIVQLHLCSTMPQFDFVMGQASEDSDISARDFLRLCRISKIFMSSHGLPHNTDSH